MEYQNASMLPGYVLPYHCLHYIRLVADLNKRLDQQVLKDLVIRVAVVEARVQARPGVQSVQTEIPKLINNSVAS